MITINNPAEFHKYYNEQNNRYEFLDNLIVNCDMELDASCIVEGNQTVNGNQYIKGNQDIKGSQDIKCSQYVMGYQAVKGIKLKKSITVNHIGSRNSNTIFYIPEDDNIKIFVKCGCFNGTITEFLNMAHKRHGKNLHFIEYKKTIKYIKNIRNIY